jgi:hypothetical protein
LLATRAEERTGPESGSAKAAIAELVQRGSNSDGMGKQRTRILVRA